MAVFAATFPNEFRSFEQVRATFTDEDWAQMITSNFAGKYSKMAAFSQQCNYEQFINNVRDLRFEKDFSPKKTPKNCLSQKVN